MSASCATDPSVRPCQIEVLEPRILLSVTEILPNMPEYFWFHGCSPTSAGMVMGYWDSLAYPNYFVGSADTQTSDVEDGIASPGHIADYVPTPDRVPPPDYHIDDCIADFMRTSRDPRGHGSTDPSMIPVGMDDYAAYVGYSAADSWADNWSSFTWAEFTGEIDAGRPMVFGVDSDGDGDTDHSVPVFAYRDDPVQQYGCYTTWTQQPGLQWFDWQGMSSGDPWGIYQGRYFHPCRYSPDLAGLSADVSPEPLQWGDSFSMNYSIKNYGGAAAGGSYVRFYMSSNDYISTSDYYLGQASVPALGANGWTGNSVTLSLPATAPTGFTATDDIWVGMIVDAIGNVSEGVESNNRNLGMWTDFDQVHVTTAPDLRGTAFSLDQGILNFGQVSADYTIENGGTTGTGGFYVYFYLSEDADIDTGDDYLGYKYISGLSGGASTSGTANLTVPSADALGGDGSYYIGMVIDPTSAVPEADEANNASVGLGVDYAKADYGVKIVNIDFEHGDGAVEIVNDTAWAPMDGLWHVTTHRGGDSNHSGTHSMYYGREKVYDYDIGDSAGVFYTKRFEVPEGPSTLSIKYLAEVEAKSDVDHILVQVYDPDIGTYTSLMSKTDVLDNDTSGLWVQAKTDLSDFAGRNVRLRFTVDTINGLNNTGEGWYVDDITVWANQNPLAVEAYRCLNPESDYYYFESRINASGDHDTVIFNEEQTDGTILVTTEDHDSAVNPALAIYDGQTGEMLYIDDGSGDGDEAAITIDNAGRWNTYLVEIWDLEEDSSGDLNIAIESAASSFVGDLTLDAIGNGSESGYINDANDTDYYRVTAPDDTDGVLTIDLVETSGSLRTRLQVWKNGGASPVAVRSSVESAETAVIAGVQPGDTFEISVSDNTFYGTGGYLLEVAFDQDMPDTYPGGYDYWIPVNAAGEHHGHFVVSGPGDYDGVLFATDKADATAVFTAEGDSGTAPALALYDADTGARLAYDPNIDNDGVATFTASINNWTRYYIMGTTRNNASGGFDLSIETLAPSSQAVTIPPGGVSDVIAGNMDDEADVDYYTVVAPPQANGTLEINLVNNSVTLRPALTLFSDATGQFLNSTQGSVGGDATLITSGIEPGGSYTLAVSSSVFNAGTGAFDVQFVFSLAAPPTINPADVNYSWTPDPFGDQTFTGDLTSTQTAEIWAIRPEASGLVAASAMSNSFATAMALYDAAGNQLDYSAADVGGTASVNTTGTGAAIYYVYVSSFGGTETGVYQMAFDVPTFPTMINIPIDPSTGLGSRDIDSIDNIPDQDWFLVTAPLNAQTMTVTMDPDGSTLRTTLRVYDDLGYLVANDNNDSPGADAAVIIAGVAPGATYMIGAGAQYLTTGGFDIDVSFDLYNVPLAAPGLEYYGPLNDVGDREGQMVLNYGSDQDNWRFVSTTGGPTGFVATATGSIDPLIALYGGDGDLLMTRNAYSGTSETLDWVLNANEVYQVMVMDAQGDDTGDVTLLINSSGPTVHDVSMSPAGEYSAIASMDFSADPTKADVDYFRWTMPAHVDGDAFIAATPGDAFSLQYQLFDEVGDPVGALVSSPSGAAAASTTFHNLNPGETYTVAVFSNRFEDHPAGAGADYQLQVDYDLRPDLADLTGAPWFCVKPVTLALEAWGAHDDDGDLAGVDFYHDANDNGLLDGPDAWLGRDSYGPDGYQYSMATGSWAMGRHRFFAAAVDAKDNHSDPRMTEVVISDYLPGDGNTDGSVDDADYTLWADHYNEAPAPSVAWGHGDYNLDGVVDDADYTIWADHYGMTVSAGGGGETASLLETQPALAEVDPATLEVASTLPAAPAAHKIAHRLGRGPRDAGRQRLWSAETGPRVDALAASAWASVPQAPQAQAPLRANAPTTRARLQSLHDALGLAALLPGPLGLPIAAG